ncbi:hypothetical protein [Brevundimonas sp.]|uniref:hypothetical protein n=1 Tax=Brevundimonas sp. TaxID=1871086 RepID=UPI002FC848D8
MTDAHFSNPIHHPLHTLISWPAVIAGGIVAVAVGAMLNLLGVALGASAFNPYEFGGGDASGFTAAAGMWMAFANAIALFIGAAVATRAAKYADHHKGALHGLAVWALAFLLAITIASAAGAGGAAALIGGEAADSDGRSVVTDIAPASRVIEGELVAPVVVQPSAPAVAEDVADTTAMLALWGFLTMLIGAIAAIFGGLYGGRNHRWINKAVDSRHDDIRREDVRREDIRPERAPIL